MTGWIQSPTALRYGVDNHLQKNRLITSHCAFIGFGKSTTRYHLPYVLNRKNSWHVAYISRHSARPEEQAPQHSHIHFTSDLDEILNDPQVKLVIIHTHTDNHLEYAKRALKAGENVPVEKPFIPTFVQAKKSFELTQSRELVVTPYQNRCFSPCFLTTKKAIEGGRPGKIVEVGSHFDYYRPEVETKPELPQDGVFYGLGVHIMGQIILLFGRLDHATYGIRSLHNKASPDGTFEVQLFYGDLKVVAKISHLVKTDHPKFIAHGTKGSSMKYGINQQEVDLKANIMPGKPGPVIDDPIGMLEHVNDDGIAVKEEVRPEMGDHGRVYDLLYQTLIAGTPDYVKGSGVLINLGILGHVFEQATPATMTLAKQPVQTPLVLFIFFKQRSQFSPSMTPDGLSPRLLHREYLGVNTIIYLRETNDRGHANYGWLDSWHIFSFVNHYDPNFMGFSALRVVNDDVIDAGQGLGTHPYKGMRVLTYVLEGVVKHQDSTGNKEQAPAGEPQTMSAGAGIRHSEYNPSNTEKLHPYQIWTMPQESGITPRCEQRRFGATQGKQLVLSPDVRDGSLKTYQDMELCRWALVRDEQSVYQIVVERRAWIQAVKGNVTINGIKATTSDGLAIWSEQAISAHTDSNSEVLLFDLPPV